MVILNERTKRVLIPSKLGSHKTLICSLILIVFFVCLFLFERSVFLICMLKPLIHIKVYLFKLEISL